MIKKHSDDYLADPSTPVPEWEERPAAATGDEAKALGRMLLDETVPAGEVITRARRGPAALGLSGSQSPVLRFRVAEEEQAELQEVARESHRNQSELLREGLRLVLARYHHTARRPAAEATTNENVHSITMQLTDSELAVLRSLAERAGTLAS